MKFLRNFFDRIAAWFGSPQVKHTFEQVAGLVSMATPIVAAIAALTPNRTDDEIMAAYQRYGVPLTTVFQAGDQTAIGNALLNLATSLLRAKLGDQQGAVATNLLQTAIQIAVTALKAS